MCSSFRLLLCRGILAGALCLASFSAMAVGISFRLMLSGATLVVTPLGEGQAFYPAVLRMLPDGRWEALAAKPGAVVPAEWLPGRQLEMAWPDTRPLQRLTSFEQLQPVMVRYYEKDGVSFGQIAFINAPPPAMETLQAGYADGMLAVAPPQANRADAAPNAIRATWVLWPQEEGISPLRKALHYDHAQPPAQRIEWYPGAKPAHIDTGRGQPYAMLLHETGHGYVVQTVEGSGLQGWRQRAAWIEAGSRLLWLALLPALLAVMALTRHFVRGRREKTFP